MIGGRRPSTLNASSTGGAARKLRDKNVKLKRRRYRLDGGGGGVEGNFSFSILAQSY